MKYVNAFVLMILLASLSLDAHAFGSMGGMGGGGEASVVQGTPLAGKVVETFNGGGYTYVRLERDGKTAWAAIPETSLEVGREVTLKPGMEMQKFFSKALNRTFDSIYFSEGMATQAASTTGKNSAGSKGGVVTPAEKIAVEKAAGATGFTVAELHGNREKLDGKTITVRAKVTKVSAGIMGKNWLHLQDGSGDSSKGSHDLTVTTQDLPAVGEVVTITGTLRKDKDFGGGYRYDAIVEDGTVSH